MPKYPYTLLPAKPRPIYKPIIYITLSYKKTHKITHQTSALIDSGADVCFCTKDIGLWLGIQFKKKEQVIFTAANSAKFKAVKENINIYVAGKNYLCPFYFTDVLPRETPIILGQLGFFDHFKVCFDIRDQTIEIS